MADLAVLTMPPKADTRVCETCRSWRRREHARCWNCQTAEDQLGFVTRVLPVSLYVKPSELREWVTFYKTPGNGARSYAELLKNTLRDFLEAYGSAIREDFGSLDFATPIPATKSSGNAVSQLFGPSSQLLAPLRNTLEFSTGASPKPGTYDPTWLDVTTNVRDSRVAVVDDVYTSGVHAQSASAALRNHGAEVPFILVIARRINPDFTVEAGALWEEQSALRYDLSTLPYWR
ncbi:hypothetical protein K0651_13150 [Ornithinimicrobium sp. Arc0846-15]|nr:hypothetical protein [Ornithinimicrobium laminariae]